jgi:selenocysteine lyase/cysteine desulfurase
VDSAQLIAHRKINMLAADIDFLAFSAHKVYAPVGSGALIARRGLLRFHTDELGEIRASGEENLGGIAALGKSLMLLNRIGMQKIEEEERMLTERTLDGLAKIDSLRLFGVKSTAHAGFSQMLGVILFDKKTMMPKSLASKLAQEGGIGVRYGCHCAHIIVKQILGISPGLETFQRWIQLTFPRLKLQGVVRVSFGIENTVENVDRFIDKISAIVQPSNNATSGGGDQQKSTKQTRKEIKAFIAMRSQMVFESNVCEYDLQ